MKKYRRKPLAVEAIQIDPNTLPTIRELPEYGEHFEIKGHIPRHIDPDDLAFVYECGRFESEVYWGDYLVRDVEGNLYPCARTVFEATHEEVAE